MSPQRDPKLALVERFERIAKTLRPEDLARDGDDEEDFEQAIVKQLTGRDDGRLLGFYGRQGLYDALEAYGLVDGFRVLGYRNFDLRFELEDFRHTLIVEGDGEVLLLCRLRRVHGASDPCIAEFQRHFTPELLYVEWLQLQDPRGHFTFRRPALPGQTTPGTGLGDEVFILIYLMARRLHLSGILDVPERFHNAVLYRRKTHFIDPAVEGRFCALLGLLDRYTLAEVAWAMEEGRVIDELSGEPVVWRPREQLLPMRREVEKYFESAAWRKVVAESRNAIRPRLIPVPD